MVQMTIYNHKLPALVTYNMLVLSFLNFKKDLYNFSQLHNFLVPFKTRG
jgi:hypothetical protein